MSTSNGSMFSPRMQEQPIEDYNQNLRRLHAQSQVLGQHGPPVPWQQEPGVSDYNNMQQMLHSNAEGAAGFDNPQNNGQWIQFSPNPPTHGEQYDDERWKKWFKSKFPYPVV